MTTLFRNLARRRHRQHASRRVLRRQAFSAPGLGLQLGLLELRAFEMPPHVRMGLLQMLLVRALVCMFWKTPFEGRLVRWGAALHDRFMLPYFVRRDLAEVLARLRQSGFDFEETGLRLIWNFVFRRSGQSPPMESSLNSAAPSSPGMCLRRRQSPAEPFAVLTHLLSGSR